MAEFGAKVRVFGGVIEQIAEVGGLPEPPLLFVEAMAVHAASGWEAELVELRTRSAAQRSSSAI